MALLWSFDPESCCAMIHLRRIPGAPRAFLVRYRGHVLGEIAYSSYEAHHSKRGWRIVDPPHLELERFRFRWQAARRLLHAHRSH